MLDAGGGGGYGGTDWNSKDVRAMWAAIANQDTDSHFEVVQGWRQTAELTLAHLGQVTKYRDNLASVWPPSRSAASAAYIERLNKLIADLQATHEAASANYTAFSTVTLTLSLARTKLKPILEQYEANQQLNLDWQAKQDTAAAKSAAPLVPQFAMPPVSAARQEQLNNEARVVMYDLSNTVISGRAALVKPKPYDPSRNGDRTDESKRGGDDGGSSFVTPPIIPPPGGGSNTITSSSGGHLHTSGSFAQQPTTTPTGTAPGAGVGAETHGPVLGGISQSPVITPPATGLPTPPITNPSPGTPGLVPGVIAPNSRPGLPAPESLRSNLGKLPGGTALKPGSAFGPSGRMAMPSGTVIGGSGGFVGQVPSNPSAPRGGITARPNPVGGMIGQPGPGQVGGPNARGATARPAASTGVPSGQGGQLLGQPGRRNEGTDERSEGNQWDPDNPWATEQGVPPVLLPSSDSGPIDPGPAIGLNR